MIRHDPWNWMKDRTDPELLSYLKAENDYTNAQMESTTALQEKLFQELRQREPQADETIPYPKQGWHYFYRTFEDKDYQVLCRRKAANEGIAATTILDMNQLAEGHSYFSLEKWDVNSQQNVLTYSVDLVGRRIATIHFRDLETGRDRDLVIENTTGQFEWLRDGQWLFYTRQHPVTLRPFQLFRHQYGTTADKDVLVYQEDDEQFNLELSKSRSKDFLILTSRQSLATEVRLMPVHRPESAWTVVMPRERDHDYTVDHLGDSFYIRTNRNAKNFRLMKCSTATVDVANWQEIIPNRVDTFLDSFDLFDRWIVASETRNAQKRLRILSHEGTNDHEIEFDESAYTPTMAPTEETDARWIRLDYMSPTTPSRVYEYNPETRELRLLKEKQLRGGYRRENYVCERLWATARDGTKVPVTIVHRANVQRNGEAPLYIFGYGAYGISMPSMLALEWLSLMDRGFVVALAHVRGGQEMGREWYEQGKLLNKRNTFTDFIDVTEYLLHEKIASPGRVFAHGGSAGGLLMGAVINMRPDLYHGVIAEVPFVDVVTTMLDASIPLTTSEYDEWGNPNVRKCFDYILSYSPFDQVKAQRYPHLLVTSGFHDSQVQYWEPTKWVAKLRSVQHPEQVLLLKTNMDAGHGGKSARNDRYRETAFNLAFLLRAAGISD